MKQVIEELNDEAYDAYVSYISSLLDFHTIDGKQIERLDVYEKMDELCQLTKMSSIVKAPNCYAEQLLYYYEAYARCDEKYAYGNTIPAFVFWNRGIKSLKKFMRGNQSFKDIELLEDAVKIFLCIMREAFKSTKKRYLCKVIQFSINEKDIETIYTFHEKKTKGKYSGFRPDTRKVFGKTILIPTYEEDLVLRQRQQEKDYVFMITTALYCRLMESEGFY